MSIRDRLTTPHGRRGIVRRLTAALSSARRRVLAAAAVILAVGGCVKLAVELAHHERADPITRQLASASGGEVSASGGEVSAPPVSQAADAQAKFLVAIARVCDAVNANNKQTPHVNARLQRQFDRTRTRNEAAKVVLTALSRQINAGADEATLLASAKPPSAVHTDYTAARSAFGRNLQRMRHYWTALAESKTPKAVQAVLRAARRDDTVIANDRQTIRSSLLAVGGGTCHLDATPVSAPVFPPAFYAGDSEKIEGAKPVATASTQGSSDHDRSSAPLPLPRGTSSNPPRDSPGVSPSSSAPPPPVRETHQEQSTEQLPMPTLSPDTPPEHPGRLETASTTMHTWTDATVAGGDAGPTIEAGTEVEVVCRVHGFRVADGNDWWYRIASPSTTNPYYASADGFYNNNSTTGSPQGTPMVDDLVPVC